MYKNFFKDKKVFITGHTGFKGSWLIHLLKQLGADLSGYALAPCERSLFELTQAYKLCENNIFDIRDAQNLKKKVIEFNPDIIFHLAAQPLVLNSYEQPAYTFDVNLMGTINLLEAVRELSSKCAVIIVTTDKVYHDQQKSAGYTETDILGGYDPYSASKAAVELATNSYRNSFFNSINYNQHQKTIATARAGNVIGGGDNAKNRIMPDIALALNQKKTVKLRNPFSVRPWQHVLDALSGYCLLAYQLYTSPQNDKFSSAWNFGPNINETYTVEEVTQIAIDSWKSGTFKSDNSVNKPKETSHLALDPSKANQHLKWHPKWNTQEAIKSTMEWYQAVLSQNRDPTQVTQQQINSFLYK